LTGLNRRFLNVNFFVIFIVIKFFGSRPVFLFGAGKFKLGVTSSQIGRRDLDSRRGRGYDSVLFEFLRGSNNIY
jgi:hypothetical protein